MNGAMNCRRAAELFSDHIEGALPSPLAADLEEHLASCAECRSLWSAFEVILMEGLRRLPRPEPSPDLLERVVAAITRPELAPPRPATGFGFPRRGAWAAGAAAAIFLAAVVLEPPALVVSLLDRGNQIALRTWSAGLRVYYDTRRLVDELNVLRATVGIAFEDRLDRLNERLKELEDARRKRDRTQEQSGLPPPSGPEVQAARSTPIRSMS